MCSEAAWAKSRKDERRSLGERLDYNSTLTNQDPHAPHRVLYTRSGTHVSACVVDISAGIPKQRGIGPAGFMAESGTYWYAPESTDEAHYLAAVLNSGCVNRAIKPYQTRGAYKGERDIHRRPFEVLPEPIPVFNPSDARHARLAQLSRDCHSL